MNTCLVICMGQCSHSKCMLGCDEQAVLQLSHLFSPPRHPTTVKMFLAFPDKEDSMASTACVYARICASTEQPKKLLAWSKALVHALIAEGLQKPCSRQDRNWEN